MTIAKTKSQRSPRPRRTIRSIEDLFLVMRRHASSHFVYRGEDDVNYKLRPKFGRYEAAAKADAEEMELAVLTEFCRRSAPHIKHAPENELEWLALAQHHGLATRLLDWSQNLLVATYFAVTNFDKDGDRVLYALCIDGLDDLDSETSPFEIDQVRLFSPKHISPRISSQMGVFTVHPEPAKEFKHLKLERWIIKEDAVIDIGISLDQIGFNAATMFPGLDGIAKNINDWHVGDKP